MVWLEGIIIAMSSTPKLVREFLKGFNGTVRLLQMRPMTKKPRWPPEATYYSNCLTIDLKIQKYKYTEANTKIQKLTTLGSRLPTHWSDCLTADLLLLSVLL